MFKPELLHIISFRLVKFSINDINEIDKELDYYYQVENNVELSFNKEQKYIRAKINIPIEIVSVNDDKIYSKGDFAVEIIYMVENFDELSNLDESMVLNIDTHLSDNIIAITYSTTRGCLIEKFKDTSFDGFILPIIDIHKDIVTNSL